MKTNTLFRSILLSSSLCVAAFASAASVITIPNGTGTIDAAGDPANTVINFTVTGPAYTVTPTITVGGGTLTEQPGHEATFASEARMRISLASNPTVFADFQMSTIGGYTGTLTLNAGQNIAAINNAGFVGSTLNPGDVLRIEFFESFQDGAAGEAESIFDGASFTLGTVVPPPTATFDFGTVNSTVSDTRTYGPNEIKWFKFTLDAPMDASRKLDINTELTTAFGAGNDTEIGLYANDGTLIANDDDSGVGFTSLITRGGNTAPVLAAGTYWVAVGGFNTTFAGAWGATSASAESGDIVLELRVTPVAPPTPPTVVRDFGTVSANVSDTRTYTTAEVKWYKFTLAAPITATDFFEINTRQTTGFLGGTFGDNDTEIGLYSDTGAMLFNNDDEDFANDILTSAIGFGTAGTNGELAAGTYYVAVGGFNMVFNGGWDVVSTSTATGDIILELAFSGGGGGGSDVTGTVTLSDLSNDPAGEVIQWEVRDAFNTAVDSGTATLGAGGTYGFDTTVTGFGFTVWIKGATWLGKSTFGVDLSAPAVVNVTLINGDVDGDNEVGGSDLSILSGAFLSADGDPNYVAGADLDQDGEVGSNDLSILSGNFLLSGD